MTYYFIGDGCEVLACEAYEANAIEKCASLKREMHLDADCISVYQRDATEIGVDDAGDACWSNPAEYAAAVAAGYDMPTLDEVVARESRAN